jgi:NAD(P)-dependent dehydrogenase (short-subunit alcohol dehydrogenase family)
LESAFSARSGGEPGDENDFHYHFQRTGLVCQAAGRRRTPLHDPMPSRAGRRTPKRIAVPLWTHEVVLAGGSRENPSVRFLEWRESMGVLARKVVVVTGASSGIGREASVEFARRGARLVLAARRADALEETARQCRSAGGEALVVPTDVTRDEDVVLLVERALSLEGRVDVWVNNAGVTLFAMLEEASLDDHRRVIETNLFGAMRCARVVVPIFRRQGTGVMINVGSILSRIGQPFVPSYVISKFALRGMTEALRVEFADRPDVHFCTLLPYAVSTQHFETGANRLGRPPRPVPPVQPPSKVARALVDLAERPRRQRHVPRIAALGLMLHAVMPRAVERTLLHVLASWHFRPELTGKTEGDLREPSRVPARVVGSRGPRAGSWELFGWILLRFVRIMTRPAPPPAR